jgi:hypothetical protein
VRRALAMTAALAAALPATAGAAPIRQAFTGTFTSATPGASTGYRLAIDYFKPGDPQGKAPAVQRVVQQLHAGSRLDTSVPPRCGASDAELASQGAAACPTNTRVGQGEIDADIGQGLGRIPRVIKTTVTVFNANRELILYAESTNAGDPPLRVPTRTAVGDRTFTSQAPPIPAADPSDPYLAIKRVRLSISAVTRAGRAFIKTPPSCAAGGAWTNTGTFTYRDGQTQTVSSRSPCSGRLARRRDRWAPRIRIRGLRRRGCAARPFRPQVRIGERNPLRRAAVSVDRRRLRSTKRKRFRVRIPIERLRSGRHRLVVVAVDATGNRARRTFRFRRC